jgi:hypothetical protein
MSDRGPLSAQVGRSNVNEQLLPFKEDGLLLRTRPSAVRKFTPHSLSRHLICGAVI